MEKNPPAGDAGSIPRSRKWQPILTFLPRKSHGQRSLGVHVVTKERDTTE